MMKSVFSTLFTWVVGRATHVISLNSVYIQNICIAPKAGESVMTHSCTPTEFTSSAGSSLPWISILTPLIVLLISQLQGITVEVQTLFKHHNLANSIFQHMIELKLVGFTGTRCDSIIDRVDL